MQSKEIVKNYAENFGYENLSNKKEYLAVVERFLIPELTEKLIVFEVFTNYKDVRAM